MKEDTLNQLVDSIIHEISIQTPVSTNDSPASMIMGIIVGGLIFVLLLVFLFRKKLIESWSEGEIPYFFSATRSNLMEIYIAAGAAMARKDIDTFRSKIFFMDDYFKKHFPGEYYDFCTSYTDSVKNVLKLKSLAQWCNNRLDIQEKIKILNFLAGVACYDSEINELEKAYLLTLMSKLHLKYSDFDERYIEFFECKKKEVVVERVSNLSYCYQVLGLELNANLLDVKKAYRNLVKTVHPDLFMHESEDVKRSKSEEFRIIQLAYELIVEKLR